MTQPSGEPTRTAPQGRQALVGLCSQNHHGDGGGRSLQPQIEVCHRIKHKRRKQKLPRIPNRGPNGGRRAPWVVTSETAVPGPPEVTESLGSIYPEPAPTLASWVPHPIPHSLPGIA